MGINETTVEPPNRLDIEIAIQNLKNNKSPGEDNLQAELFKYGGEEIQNKLYELISKIWEEERMPDEWKRGMICPLFKKGDPLVCSNYRGICLLNIAYKLLSAIIRKKLLPFVEKELGQYQSGFRNNKSTIDQIFTIRQILEKTNEYKTNTYHLFVDFRAAYDSIKREQLYIAMLEFGLPLKLIRLTRMTLEGACCKVKIQNDKSMDFQCNKGLRQGDGLSCLLFNIALEKVIRDAEIQRDHTIFTKSVQLLGYDDDIDIIGRINY